VGVVKGGDVNEMAIVESTVTVGDAAGGEGGSVASPQAAADGSVVALTKQLAQLERTAGVLTSTISEQSAALCSQMAALSSQVAALSTAMQRGTSSESPGERAEEEEIDDALREMFADDSW